MVYNQDNSFSRVNQNLILSTTIVIKQEYGIVIVLRQSEVTIEVSIVETQHKLKTIDDELKSIYIFVVISNSSKVAPYIRHMNGQRVAVAVTILVLAASGYAIGLLVAKLWKKDHETSISMMYGNGMRNISVGAVIAAAYFPGEVMFPVMIGTLFQQVLAAFYGKATEQPCDSSKN